ncbi:MAG: hypothetical protein SFU25_06565, partial [Candidatus Caenarcaniphilales bacterium]|nr:hypothetical protein [Candidatus Caenarcaniphilales bacterium]
GMERDLFVVKFLEKMGDESTLHASLYEGVIEFLSSFLENLKSQNQSVLLCSWTQGNVFLQTRKSQIFQNLIPREFLAKPSIYASLDKIGLLPNTYQDLKDQGCDLICLIDDRLVNVLAARTVLHSQPALYIHKIRPDKNITHRLQEEDENLFESKNWGEIEKIINKKSFRKLGLILDKDGIIFNTTIYRELLEQSLVDFAESFLVS